MSMLSGKVTVPPGVAVPIVSVGGVDENAISTATEDPAIITGRLNFAAMGLATTVVFVHASPGGAPSAATVVAEGTPIVPGASAVSINDSTAGTLPDMRHYYAAVGGVVTGDLRVLG